MLNLYHIVNQQQNIIISKETKSITNQQLEIEFGSDSLSLVFLLLSGFLMGLTIFIIISSLNSNQFQLSLLTLIYIHLILVFISINFIFFLIQFEVILILMYFLVSNQGTKLHKIRSSYYLFIFTIFGSVFLLISIILLFIITGSTNLILLENFQFNVNQQISLAIIIIIGFGNKVPIFPFHI